MANILHTFSTQVIRAVEDYFHEQGFHIIVCNADDEPEKEKKYIEMLRAKQVDGIIIFPTGENLSLYEKMKRDTFPVVFMDRTIEELGIPTVMLDNHHAAGLAVDRFIESGIKRIAIITTSIIREISPRVERIEGYKKALDRHGMMVRDEYIKTADAADISNVLSELFSLEEPPKAILAANDIVLVEVLKYMKEHDMTIPDKAAVIGIDEVPFAGFFTPPITTIVQPAAEMARKAGSLLLRQIQEKDGGEKRIHRYKPVLLARQSG
ncbi:Hexuronate utilization operon transcriptional repressor ExuR [Bacillus amyloliquefaciens]|nr:Hexuronate utilization operon transcriptional repressor ExuR [Bacillus amyloliquefaciens]